MKTLIDLFLHLDHSLGGVITRYGAGVYGLIFAIVFCETGVVVTPFLPGDSLLFAAGSFAAIGSLNVWTLIGVLLLAAIGGDTANYWIGRRVGERALHQGRLLGLPIRKEHVERTHHFYEKYGGKTMIIARFMPIIRTLAPFIAGVGDMEYSRFLAYNAAGGGLWVLSFTFGGYFFGNLPFVKNHFGAVIMAIIVISIIPSILEVLRAHRRKPAA